MNDDLDLDQYMPADQIEHQMVAPGTGRPVGWTVILAGPSHPKAIAWADAQQRRRLARAAQIEAARLNGRRVDAEERTPGDIRRDNVGWICSRILGWSPAIKVPSIEPDAIAWSDEAAARLFAHPKMGWAVEQLVDVLGSEQAFTRRSAGD